MEQRDDFDLKYIFNDEIERVWSFVRDPASLYEANKSYFVSFNAIESKVNLWTVDCLFTFSLPSGSELSMKCIKSTSDPYYKYLSYECIVSDTISFHVHYSLYQVSTDNTTILQVEFNNIKSVRPEQADLLQNRTRLLFKKHEKYMQKSILSLFQNEGAIIYCNISDLWNMIMDWNVTKQLSVLHADAFIPLKETQSYQPFETGSIFKLVYLKENEVYYKVKSVDKKEGSSKWEIVFEYLSSCWFYFKELRLILISINPKTTQITFCHHFSMPETPERIKQLGALKKKILYKLKSMAEKEAKPADSTQAHFPIGN